MPQNSRKTLVFVMLFDKSKHSNQSKILIMTAAASIWHWVSIFRARHVYAFSYTLL